MRPRISRIIGMLRETPVSPEGWVDEVSRCVRNSRHPCNPGHPWFLPSPFFWCHRRRARGGTRSVIRRALWNPWILARRADPSGHRRRAPGLHPATRWFVEPRGFNGRNVGQTCRLPAAAFLLRWPGRVTAFTAQLFGNRTVATRGLPKRGTEPKNSRHVFPRRHLLDSSRPTRRHR